MNVVALDIGNVRCGIAYASTETKIAHPIKVLATSDIKANSKSWKDILRDYMPQKFIFGCPVSLNGKKHSQANNIENFARELSRREQIEFEFFDERYSSTQAKQILREGGLSEKQMRGKVDSIAASIFLQAWLDANF